MNSSLNISDIKNAVKGGGDMPTSGTVKTTMMGAATTFRIDGDGTMKLNIDGYWFAKEDLKELRKFLKIAIAALEAQE